MTQAIFLHTPGKELNMNIKYIFRAFLNVFARRSLSCFQTVFQRREPVAGVHSHLQIQNQTTQDDRYIGRDLGLQPIRIKTLYSLNVQQLDDYDSARLPLWKKLDTGFNSNAIGWADQIKNKPTREIGRFTNQNIVSMISGLTWDWLTLTVSAIRETDTSKIVPAAILRCVKAEEQFICL